MEIVTTADGSKTLFHKQVGENYHSKHGALQESKHVFVGKGLEDFFNSVPNATATGDRDLPVRVLEIGFGTGLNFLTSLESAEKNNFSLDYHAVEAYPLLWDVIFALDYAHSVNLEPGIYESFAAGYVEALEQNRTILIGDRHKLQIESCKVLQCKWQKEFDVLYFDAFAAIHQPEMWTEQVLRHATAPLVSGGYFVTYAITGDLKRTLKGLGFEIQKLPGAPGKREMLRAIKM